MSSAKQVTKKIHEIESGVKKDPKQANGILQIKKYLAEGQNREVRQAALNSLRRIFCEFLESGRLTITKESGSKKDKQDDGKKSKLREYKVWLKKQFTDFQDTLCGFVSGRDEETITPAIRTMIEFTRREWMITRGQEDKDQGGEAAAAVMTKKAHFGVECFTSLMRALCYSDKDVEVEVLLMMRNEIFDKADCRFFAWLVLRKLLVDAKTRWGKPEGATASSSSSSSVTPEAVASIVQNGLDLLRILSYEDQEVIDEGEYLVDRETCIEYSLRDGLDDDAGSGSSDDEDVDDEDEDDEDEGNTNTNTKAAAAAAARKRKAVLHNDKKNKKRKAFRKMTRAEQVADELSHTKVFSKAWLALLALPLTKGQHKLALKHLPDHVIVHMANPLLLADYLTGSYNLGGGSIAVLALQSLFTLIVAHNLDYPDYFPSLYVFCSTIALPFSYHLLLPACIL
jgi:U3 small nucleolar RNA-associated protein 19